MKFTLDDSQVPDGTILVFGIRYVDSETGSRASSKVFEYVGLKAGGRWYLTGTGRVPQDAGWGAVARWLDDPTREVVSVRTVTGTAQIYPPPNPPASDPETTEADRRDVYDISQVAGLAQHFTVDSLRDHLVRKSVRNIESGCLEYQGFGRNRGVYQKVSIRAMAHIAAYACFVGGYDPDLDVHHTCDNPSCIEPSHLKQVTHRQNMSEKRSVSKCGHDRERDQLGKLKRCRICNARAQARWRKRRDQGRGGVADPR